MRNINLFLALIFASSIPSLTFAWGSEGHKIVDRMAYDRLDKSTKDSMLYYLGDTKFENAGNWMDEIRSNHDFDYMKPWHYINIAKGEKYDPSSTNNIVSELDSTISHLQHRNRYSKEQIAMEIKMVMHLIGDLHQPLHVGYATDRGGNALDVGLGGHKYNLHKVWDTGIIQHDYFIQEKCLDILKKSDIPPVTKIDVIAWMNDSRSYLTSVYEINNGLIDEAYLTKNTPIVERELVMAGLRLSYVLNSLFK